MQFSNVIGQEPLKKHLIESYRAERTAHAQIFVGPEGSGQLALALAYAQFLLCEDQQEEDACGQCNACKKVQKLIHPDLHFSYPTIGTGAISTQFVKEWRSLLLEEGFYIKLQDWLNKLGAENQKGNINKNECLDIVKKFSFTKVEGRFKVLILWLPEFLDKEGNRLLKLIEEPEPNTVFILVAERAEKILNTILSRCQLMKVPALQDEEVAAALQEQHEIAKEQAMQLAYMSEGNYRKALSLLNASSDDQNFARLFANWLRACYIGREQMPYWVDTFVTGKHPIDGKTGSKTGRREHILFLQYGLFFLRELLVLKISEDSSRLRLSANEIKTAQGLSKILSIGQIDQIQQLFDDTIYFVERNANAKILFMATSVEIHRVFKPLQKA